MYDKNDFKSMFGRMGNEQLIANALLPLTEEAMQATSELLAERGLDGHGLELAIAQTKRDLVQRTSVTNECDYKEQPLCRCWLRGDGMVVVQRVRQDALLDRAQHCDRVPAHHGAAPSPELVCYARLDIARKIPDTGALLSTALPEMLA